MSSIVGVDFDNTIVSYDDIMHSVAAQLGLIHRDVEKSKRLIRDKIRQMPKGEVEWQKLQAIMYGQRMEEARLIDGAGRFLELCKQHNTAVYIISHKTEYANYDETGTNLREAALTWMKERKFFEADGLGLSQRHVYFEWTRRAKIERIRHLKCTHFIDDLEETFLEDSFPANVEKILYAPHMQHPFPRNVRVFTTWEEISHYFFSPRG